MRAALLIALLLLLRAVTFGQEPRSLGDLAVPVGRLPTGCVLAATPSVELEGNRLRGGFLWAGLPNNPWSGDDVVRIASIAGAFFPPARMPDGPPLNKKDAALFRLRLAEGIEEGYEAVYLPNDTTVLLIVYGLRFPTPAAAHSFVQQSQFAENPDAVQVRSLVALVAGPAGDCHDAVLAHVRSLAR